MQMIFITERVTQGSTTITVQDTLHTVMLATHILTVVDGGVGEGVVVQCKHK